MGGDGAQWGWCADGGQRQVAAQRGQQERVEGRGAHVDVFPAVEEHCPSKNDTRGLNHMKLLILDHF